jgi:hypothetical protein
VRDATAEVGGQLLLGGAGPSARVGRACFDQLSTGTNLPTNDVAQVLITVAERSLCR